MRNNPPNKPASQFQLKDLASIWKSAVTAGIKTTTISESKKSTFLTEAETRHRVTDEDKKLVESTDKATRASINFSLALGRIQRAQKEAGQKAEEQQSQAIKDKKAENSQTISKELAGEIGDYIEAEVKKGNLQTYSGGFHAYQCKFSNDPKAKTYNIPYHVFQIINIYQIEAEKERKGEPTNWESAFFKMLTIGGRDAPKKSWLQFFGLGKRDSSTQAFYDLMQKAYKGLETEINRAEEKALEKKQDAKRTQLPK